MTWRVDILPLAERQLVRLPKPIRARVDQKILLLETDPRPHGSIKLAGAANLYRIRVGDYRIIYEIHGNVLVVVIVRVAHRSRVYRGL